MHTMVTLSHGKHAAFRSAAISAAGSSVDHSPRPVVQPFQFIVEYAGRPSKVSGREHGRRDVLYLLLVPVKRLLERVCPDAEAVGRAAGRQLQSHTGSKRAPLAQHGVNR